MIKQEKGFTLLELSIAVLMIAVLTTVVMPAYSDNTIHSRQLETESTVLSPNSDDAYAMLSQTKMKNMLAL